MLKRIDYKHQTKSIPLTKGQSTYNKLQKEMNEAPKDYNAIKSLIENNENSIEQASSSIQSKTVKSMPHQKKK